MLQFKCKAKVQTTRLINLFTDRRGRRWACGKGIEVIFGIREPGKKSFWDYDWLLRRSFKCKPNAISNSLPAT